MDVGREIFWDISALGNLVYLLMAVALALLIWTLYCRYLLWQTGKPNQRSENSARRIPMSIRKTMVEVLRHRQVLCKPIPGTDSGKCSPSECDEAFHLLFA